MGESGTSRGAFNTLAFGLWGTCYHVGRSTHTTSIATKLQTIQNCSLDHPLS